MDNITHMDNTNNYTREETGGGSNSSENDPDDVTFVIYQNRTIVVLNGISGTSSAFIALIIVSATFPSLLRNMLAVLNPDSVLFSGRRFWITLLVDFAFTILPVELMITILNVQSPYFFALTNLAIAAMFVITLSKRHIRTAMTSSPFLSLKMPERSPFIHYFRAYTNIFTSFSILAVDFNLYPKYFMKSRVYGTALMDSGLGFYVISNAIVSPEARGVVSSDSLRTSMIKATKDTLPLLFFGFARFYVLGMADYHVPVQEYGVHWNFFFTLAVVKMFSTLIFCVTPVGWRPFLGPGILLVYQCILSRLRLYWFVLFGFNGSASRDGFLESNREGIVASVGFLAIYFIGVHVGTVLMKKRLILVVLVRSASLDVNVLLIDVFYVVLISVGETTREYLSAVFQIASVCCSSWILMNLTGTYIQWPSRKFANLSYACFVIGVTTLLMVQGLVFDIIINYFRNLKLISLPQQDAIREGANDKSCPLLLAINYNGLLFFAVANMMTGTVNLSINTRTYSDATAFCIVTAYMLILSCLFLKLFRKKFVFKSVLWRKPRSKNFLPR